MKKGLSLLLAASLAFSAFSSAALAATELTAEEKYQALVEEGIFTGFPDGQAHLDQNMTRAQAAKIITLILGLEENAAGASVYTDLAEAEWAIGYIGAATEAGILQGYGNGIFDPSSDVTIEQLAKIMVEALDIEVDEDATVEGASEWAGKYVAAAVAAGLIPEQSDYTAPASRELLVIASYAAYEQVKQGEEVTATAAATGAKKITVTFNRAVDDSKASFKVSLNNNTVMPSKTTFADDKKSAVLEFSSNLRAGDYKVTVSNVAEQDLVLDVKVEAEKVAKIEFTSTNAVIERGNKKAVTVGYQVLNQYGEKINKSVSASASRGTPSVTSSTGTVTVTDTADFKAGDKVSISLLETSNQQFATQVFEVVDAAYVATVEIKGLYQKDNKELAVGSTDEFYLLLELKDQYGNKITKKSNFADDLFIDVTDEDVATLEGYVDADNKATLSENVGDDKELGIKIAKKGADYKAGKTTVSILSKLTGSRAVYEIEVKDESKIDELILDAPSLAPAGEKVEIPFTAYDQFGKEIKHPKTTDLASLTSTLGANSIYFEKDTVNDKTKLILDIPDNAPKNIFITAQTKTNKFYNLSVTVDEKAVPESISGVKDINTLLKFNSQEITKDNIVLRDQYGREIALPAGYSIEASVSGSAVSASATTLPATFKGKSKGTSTVTFTLKKGNEEIASFPYSYRVVEDGDITSYEATVSGTVYDDGGANYAKSLEVVGILSDGSKVKVPRVLKDDSNNDVVKYTVVVPTSSSALFLNSDGKIESNGNFFSEANKDGEGTVIVTILANNDYRTVPVKVSSKAPEITTLSLKDVKNGNDVIAKKVADNRLAIELGQVTSEATLRTLVEKAVTAKDQYGVEVTFELVANNMIVSGLNKAYGDLKDGDTFKVLAFSKNGVSISIDIIIVAQDL